MKIKCYLNDSPQIEEYVHSKAWMSLSDDCLIGTSHRGNCIWKTALPNYGSVVIKKTVADGDFSFFKRISRKLRLYLFNVNLRDAEMALKAESLGVETYHPLAVWKVFDHGVSCYIMYTYVEGQLFKDICNNGAYEEEHRAVVMKYVYELGQIAGKLHDGGVRHRDLVPQNLLVRPDGKLAVIDFASGYPARGISRDFRDTLNLYYLYHFVRLFNSESVYMFCRGYCDGHEDRRFSLVLSRLLYLKYVFKDGRPNRMRRWKCLLTAWMMR